MPVGVVVDALLRLEFGIEGALVEALVDPDPGARAASAAAITGRATAAARPAVRAALFIETDPVVQAELCRALGVLGEDDDVPALVWLATSGADQGRQVAVWALGALDLPGSVLALDALLSDADERVAAASARALGRMRAPGARPVLAGAAHAGSAAAAGELAVVDLRAAGTGRS